MVAPILIYILTPMIGLLLYWVLIRKMRREGVASPPEIPLFILFFTLGGWLLVLFTAWFWEWSGMASIGMFYLLFIAPILTAVVTWRLRSRRALSAFYSCVFFASGTYTGIVVVGVPLAIFTHLIGM